MRVKYGFGLWVAGATLLLTGGIAGTSDAKPSQPRPTASGPAEHVVLFVMEGVTQDSLKTGPMPAVGRLAKEGAVTWSAAVESSARLPMMASLITSLPVAKHGMTWNTFDFARGYPRPPTVFDYLDLSGGKDSAIFFMDESLYQLAKPAPYTDYQICGVLRPECNTQTIVRYIQDYFKKATSGHGYVHANQSVPHFLVVHLPEPGRVKETQGAASAGYRQALRSVDQAVGSVLDLYRELGLLPHTTVFVFSLDGLSVAQAGAGGTGMALANGTSSQGAPATSGSWIAWGAGIKTGHVIKEPVSILDVGPTVLRTMHLSTHTEWTGHAIEEMFASAMAQENAAVSGAGR
jgi:arylsulfatase A-like enzyme